MGPYHYWQHPRSISSPLNSSSGCVENGRVASRYWQCSRSVSSLLDSSSDRAENGKVAHPAASTPGRLLRIRPQGAAAGFTRWQANPPNVGWTYRERSNWKITCIVSKVLQSYITSIVDAVLTKDKNCLGREPTATMRNRVPSPGAGPPPSRFRRHG